MAIRLKVAKTPEEIDDALWVRHEVFIVEDGRFGGKPAPDARMMDRFDALPDVYNVIAYDGDQPIATIRLTKESEIGLPADEYFDFSEFRKSVANGSARSDGNDQPDTGPIFGSAGMLAIRQPWRNRRDVIRAMYRIAAGVCRSSDATHLIAVVNHQTARMYKRLGFTPLSEKFWSADIGDHVVPLAATSDDFCRWAFEDLPDTPLGIFKNGFERLFVRSGDAIFHEGDSGQHAYIVGCGHVRITVSGNDGSELTLARKNPGDLFGESFCHGRCHGGFRADYPGPGGVSQGDHQSPGADPATSRNIHHAHSPNGRVDEHARFGPADQAPGVRPGARAHPNDSRRGQDRR